MQSTLAATTVFAATSHLGAADTAKKRVAVIVRLVGSEAYVDHWTNKLADMLQVNRKFLGGAGAAALRKWIREAVASNMPYDQFANEVLTASGSTNRV